MKRLFPVALLGLAMFMIGCAGGWRGDVAPGAAVAAPVVKATPTPSTGAEGITFVWKGEGGSVSLAGEFNGWNTSADPLKKQADGSWSLTKKLEPGRYMYKFVVDGTNWKEDPTAKETADDGYGGKNSVVVVGGPAQSAGTPATAAPVAAAAKPAAASGGTTASAEGITFVWKGEGGSVSLAGEFNGWNTSADPLKKQADGSWSLTKKLEPGRYMYKFVLDGTNWKEDPTAKETADDGYGGKNSVVVVGGPAQSAGTPATAAPVAAAAKPAAASGGTTASAEGVTFVWKGEGGSVNLAGEFNGWNTSADPLKKQADGSWSLTKKLEPGRYMYKFVLDGTNWKEDPTAKETAEDGYGGKNSVVTVGAGAAVAPAAPTAGTATASGKGHAPVQTADGVVFTFGGAARSVSLAGDFNGWALMADPLVQQADASWTLTKKLAPGVYEYKFLVDGTTWKTDEANPDSKADPYGGRNSVVTVK